MLPRDRHKNPPVATDINHQEEERHVPPNNLVHALKLGAQRTSLPPNPQGKVVRSNLDDMGNGARRKYRRNGLNRAYTQTKVYTQKARRVSCNTVTLCAPPA